MLCRPSTDFPTGNFHAEDAEAGLEGLQDLRGAEPIIVIDIEAKEVQVYEAGQGDLG